MEVVFLTPLSRASELDSDIAFFFLSLMRTALDLHYFSPQASMKAFWSNVDSTVLPGTGRRVLQKICNSPSDAKVASCI